jgi:hypothetical protein
VGHLRCPTARWAGVICTHTPIVGRAAQEARRHTRAEIPQEADQLGMGFPRPQAGERGMRKDLNPEPSTPLFPPHRWVGGNSVRQTDGQRQTGEDGTRKDLNPEPFSFPPWWWACMCGCHTPHRTGRRVPDRRPAPGLPVRPAKTFPATPGPPRENCSSRRPGSQALRAKGPQVISPLV